MEIGETMTVRRTESSNHYVVACVWVAMKLSEKVDADHSAHFHTQNEQ